MKRLNVLLIICIFLMASCSSSNKNGDEKFFKSIDECEQYWTKQEGAKIVSTKQYEGSYIVLLIDSNDSISVADITKSDKGYKWNREIPYFKIDGILGLTLKTEKGREFPVLIGKSSNLQTKAVRLDGGGREYELQVSNGYFWGLNLSYYPYVVTEIS